MIDESGNVDGYAEENENLEERFKPGIDVDEDENVKEKWKKKR